MSCIYYTRHYRQLSYDSAGKKSFELVDHDFSDETPFDERPPWFRHNRTKLSKLISCSEQRVFLEQHRGQVLWGIDGRPTGSAQTKSLIFITGNA